MRRALAVVAGILFVYAVIYIDVVMRAREAVQEGDKYMAWHRDPASKVEHFEDVYREEKEKLDQKLAKKKIAEEDYKDRLSSLEFEKTFNQNESSLKYAYQWYKDAYELFSPPHSKWARMGRIKAPETLALWKEELEAQNIPFEDYMFE